MFGQISVEKLISKTDEDLSVIKENISRAYNIADKDSDELLLLLGEAYNMIDDWQQYYHKFNKVLTKNVELMGSYRELMGTLNKALETIDENAKLIASSKGNREKQRNATGSNSNRYIQELDTEELIRVYKDNNFSIPKEVYDVYHRKYGITYNGLRERLIKAGVWKGRH
jgi:hypothetical protein